MIRPAERRIFLWIINVGATLMGMVVAPRRTLAASRAGARATTLCRLDVSYPDVLALTVGELRDLLGVGAPVPPHDR